MRIVTTSVMNLREGRKNALREPSPTEKQPARLSSGTQKLTNTCRKQK